MDLDSELGNAGQVASAHVLRTEMEVSIKSRERGISPQPHYMLPAHSRLVKLGGEKVAAAMGGYSGSPAISIKPPNLSLFGFAFISTPTT